MKFILIVDDEKIIAGSIQRVLSRSGYIAETAANGIDAIQKIEAALRAAKKYDLVILDLLMPELGGAEVLDFLHTRMPSAKVLMMTAYGEAGLKDDLIRRGASAVLSKPFDDIMIFPQLVKKTLGE